MGRAVRRHAPVPDEHDALVAALELADRQQAERHAHVEKLQECIAENDAVIANLRSRLDTLNAAAVGDRETRRLRSV